MKRIAEFKDDPLFEVKLHLQYRKLNSPDHYSQSVPSKTKQPDGQRKLNQVLPQQEQSLDSSSALDSIKKENMGKYLRSS